MPHGLLDGVPITGLLILMILLVLLSIEVGYRFGRHRHRRSSDEKEAPVGAMVGSTLGLLAFVLAFTFGMASARYDTRENLLLDEANSIGTTYLRAEILPERSEEIRGLLREYVDVRLEALRTRKIAEGLRRSDEIQRRLWAHAVALGNSQPTSIPVGLFVASLNETVALHAKRVAGARTRIPAPIWVTLLVVTVLALGAMGYHSGLSQTRRSIATLVVACVFSLIITLIADLDRQQDGFLRMSQQALSDVQAFMKEAPR